MERREHKFVRYADDVNIYVKSQRAAERVLGWLGYYAIADMKMFMRHMNEWIQRKIRTYVWKQWKRVRTRFVRLQWLGISEGKAWEWANTRKGCWHISRSWILHRALPNQRIIEMGYDDILIRYNAKHSSY